MSVATVAAPPAALTITPSAAARIAELRRVEGNDALMLRVSISGGGCSGFQYGFSLDEKRNADDLVFASGGVTVVVDEVSLGLITGAEVDFVEELAGSYFAVRNPNASSTCGCGTSFAI